MAKQEIELFETGNGIILTFWWDGHFPVDDFRLWNFVKRSILARDIDDQSYRQNVGILRLFLAALWHK